MIKIVVMMVIYIGQTDRKLKMMDRTRKVTDRSVNQTDIYIKTCGLGFISGLIKIGV